MVDEQAMREVTTRLYVVAIENKFGPSGVDALFRVIDSVKSLYRCIEPTRVSGRIVVFSQVVEKGAFFSTSSGTQIYSFEELMGTAHDGLIVEVQSDGTYFKHSPQGFDLAAIRKRSVVYEYQDKQERFLAEEEQCSIIKFDKSAASQFAVPTFFKLSDALRSYASEQVRYSSCPWFNQVWSDDNRIFFKPGPEKIMRQSLTQFLKVRLGASYEVRPEQIMDESHPVDIKVTYSPGKRIMIIEIKWIGDSREIVGSPIRGHRDARAKSGAEQLAGYLEGNRSQAPTHITQGYYVIIDARRRGLNANTTAIGRDDGLHYAEKEIEFDPLYHETRDDFETPFRMFAEPICTI